MGAHYLNHMLAPQAIAVIGASDRPAAVGTLVFRNLLRGGFKEQLYPVNLRHKRVQKKKAYKTIADIGQPVDLAIIATPAKTVPDLIRQCGEAGVHAAIVMSAGFAETSDQGRQLQTEMLAHARQYGMRILGPNCLGIMRPRLGLNATFSHNIAGTGQLALVSQSGALCTAMLDWAQDHGIGFSTMVSLGDAADVDFGDLLSYLAMDAHTHAILLYVEGIRQARSFISGLRIAARMKPVVVVKAGRYQQGSRVAHTHTAAIVGSDEVFHAALRRAGAVRAYSIKQLFSAARLLASDRYRASGNRLAIVTNGGGPGVMATDHAEELNVKLAELGSATLSGLDRVLPPQWSHGNPVDILGDAPAARYRDTIKACLADEQVDGLLVLLTPQAMTEATAAAQVVVDAAKQNRKPILACWMGGQQVSAAHELFSQSQIAHFDTPETGVEAFSFLASFHRNQQLLLQVPEPLNGGSKTDTEGARLIVEGALASGRDMLTALEAFAVLKAFGVPVSPIMEAANANDALVMAESLGFPVAMKISSTDISHKSDINGVRLNVSNAADVRTVFRELTDIARQKQPEANITGVTIEPMYNQGNARELYIGVMRDPVFGPAISIGAGGAMIEVMEDKFVALPPLNSFIVRTMIESTRISRVLDAFRGMPAVNRHAIEQVLLSVSELICELPHIQELDINPLLVDAESALAVDIRMRVAYPRASLQRYDHMAIHPYPSHLVRHKQLADGSDVTIRPIRPEDAHIEQDFIRNLTPQSKYLRFMQALHELTPEMLVRFTQIDYDREMALIAVTTAGGSEAEVGVARYTINPDDTSCEFAIVIADTWHHKGLGVELMNQLIETARNRGLKVIMGEVLANNKEMLALARWLGFEIRHSGDDPQLMLVTRHL